MLDITESSRLPSNLGGCPDIADVTVDGVDVFVDVMWGLFAPSCVRPKTDHQLGNSQTSTVHIFRRDPFWYVKARK